MANLANWICARTEWDKERGSENNDEKPNTHAQTVSLLELNPDIAATPPPATTNDEEELHELDITEVGSHESITHAVSQGDIAEPQLQNNTLEASNGNIATASAHRSSTADLDNMEQGSFTNLLRRRTTPRIHVQVHLRPSLSKLAD